MYNVCEWREMILKSFKSKVSVCVKVVMLKIRFYNEYLIVDDLFRYKRLEFFIVVYVILLKVNL